MAIRDWLKEQLKGGALDLVWKVLVLLGLPAVMGLWASVKGLPDPVIGLLAFAVFVLSVVLIAHLPRAGERLSGKGKAVWSIVGIVVLIATVQAGRWFLGHYQDLRARPTEVEMKAARDSVGMFMDSTSHRNSLIWQLQDSLTAMRPRPPRPRAKTPPPSWPLTVQPPVGYQIAFNIKSYTGPCENLPPGQECLRFEDGYVMLLQDSLAGRMTSSSEAVTRSAKYADYHHVLGTDRVVVIRRWQHPERPK